MCKNLKLNKEAPAIIKTAGFKSLIFPLIALATTYTIKSINSSAIPLLIEKVRGIINAANNAGEYSEISSQSMLTKFLQKNVAIKTSAAPVA